MARFDVYPNQGGTGYLLDCQADVLSALTTRMVVPLMPADVGPPRISRLNPILKVEGEPLVMYTQLAAAIGVRSLQAPVASLADDSIAITSAFDMLLTGY